MDETTFREQLARDGFTEVLVRDVPAGTTLAEHAHAWDARLLVLGGDIDLTRGGQTEHFEPGQHCEVPCGQRHAEAHGPQGTRLLIGRRYPAGPNPAA